MMNQNGRSDGAKKSPLGSGFNLLSCLVLLSAVALWLNASPVLAQSGLGTALSFDGVDDFLVVTNFGSLAPTNEITIEFWQRAAVAKRQVTFTLAPDSGGTNRIYAAVPWEDGAVYWDFGNSTNGGRLSYVPTNSILGTWQHFALVASQSGNFMRIYRNGVLEAEKVGMTSFVRGALNLQLGGSSAVAGVGSAFFQGELDELRVWSVARSQSDITNTMHHPLTGAETNLVACYRFDEAAGIRAYDATTNCLNGTLVNRPRRGLAHWCPVVKLSSPNPMTNECHVPFVDPGAAVKIPAQGAAAGGSHSLALRADGTVVGWGTNYYGQTTVPASATNVVAIAAGWGHSLGLKADGTVIGWGYNSYGQTTIPASITSVVAIAVGSSHNLALKADGTVVGWGWNNYGQTTIPASATSVVAITAGWGHSLALKADGTVVGWGYNYYGQTTIPASATNVVAIAAGAYHSLALRADGTVVGWGRNSYGQTTIPASAVNVVAIAAGDLHSLALKADGTVVGWGDNSYRQVSIPASATNVVAIAAGASHNLALKADGTGVGWGDSAYGKSTIPPSVYSLPLSLTVSGTVDANSPGTYTLIYRSTNSLGTVGVTTRTVVVTDTLPPALALLGDNPLPWPVGSAFAEPGASATDLCAGDLTAGLSVSGTVDTDVPGNYPLTYTATDACGNTGLAVRMVAVGLPQVTTLPAVDLLNDAATLKGMVNPRGTDTIVWFEWGGSRTCGEETTAIAVSGTTPVAVNAGLTNLVPGLVYHYRLVASNSVWVVRGSDQAFWIPALTFNSPEPLTNECHTAFVDPTTVTACPVAIAAGYYHSLGLRPDGTVIGWGRNNYGQTTIPASATNVVAIAAGCWHSLALRGDRTVIGWGYNSDGPVTIAASATNVVAIAAGGGHDLALKADGTVVGWGDNLQGQTAIPTSATNVVAIAAGAGHGLALKADGRVIGWGLNNYGQTTIPASATNVVAIAAGTYHSLALKANGTVIGWGADSNGQTTSPASATNVVGIAAGAWHSLAVKADGTVVGWGAGGPGTSVYPHYGQSTIPASATNVVAIAANQYHSLAITADGTILGWGAGGPGVSGDPHYGQTIIPTSLSTLNLPVTIDGSVNTNLPGSYLLAYSVTNSLGARSTAARTVVVADTRPPILTLLGDNPLPWTVGSPFIDPGATATDLCFGDVTGSIVASGTVDPNVPGNYLLTYAATDACGNAGVAVRTVVVVTRPVLTGLTRLTNGAFQFQYTNTPGARFVVLASTNMALPLSQWTALSTVLEGPAGEFHFTDTTATNCPARFYRLCWPR